MAVKLRRLAALTLVAVLMHPLAGLAAGKMTIGYDGDVVMLDPQLAQSGYDWAPGMLIWSRLVEYDNTMMNPTPGLAESWQVSDDGKEWTFNLRKGVKFHSGREVTAEDVEFSFKRGFEIGPKGRFAGYMVSVDSFEATGTHQFRVRLKQKDVTFFANLAAPAASIVDKDTLEQIRTEPNGTGPYRFVEWSPGEHVIYRKNADYWDKATLANLPDEIKTIPIKEDQTRLANLQSGQVDMITRVPNVFWPQIDGDERLQLLGQDITASYISVVFSLEKAPFKDNKLLRQAIAHAINKEAIHQNVFFGSGEVGCSLMPKAHWAYTDIGCYEYDPVKAKRLLAASGYDTSRPIQFPTASNPAHYMRVAEVVQANLKDIGLTANIEPQEFGYYVQQTWIKRKFEMQVAWYTREIDPDGLFSSVLRKEQGNNPMRYFNPAVEALFDSGKEVADRAQRKKYYEAIMRVAVLDEMPIVKIQTIDMKWAANKKVKQFTILPKGHPNFYNFKWDPGN